MATNRNLINVFGLLVSLALVNNPIIVDGQGLPVSGLFPFGDSYYDVGNKAFLTKTLVPSTTWPYGKSTDDPNGRYSDGRVVPDFVARFINIQNPIPPALKPNADLSRGASFAVADASILGSPADSMTFGQQVLKFRELKSNWNETFLSQSLFLFYIGAEDYLNFTRSKPDADASAQEAFVTSVTSRLKQDILRLYLLGARKFAFQTLAPLGCLPIARQDYKTGDQCYEKLNDLAKLHNEKIGPMLDGLAKQYPGFQYNVFDFYNALLRRITRNINYRYFSTTKSCCGIGSHNAFGCGYSNVHSNLCEYQRSYLFFDGRHNTEKTNEAIAHLFFGADTNVVTPMNLRELLVYPPNMAMLEEWPQKKSSDVSSI